METTLETPLRSASNFADLGGWVATIIAVIVLALVLLGTLFERSGRGSAAANGLLLLSLTVLPVFMMLFGAFSSVQQAKSVEFCDSCHTAMHLYVADMRDPQSTTLASVHATQRYIPREPCYVCHASYGVWGEADAKLRGFAHLYHWLVGSPTALGLEQIDTYRPYDNELCLDCHSGSRGFLESGQGVHRMIAENLLTIDEEHGGPVTSCLVCHGPAHPDLETPDEGAVARAGPNPAPGERDG